MADVVVVDTLTPEEKIVLLNDLKRALYTGASRVKFKERDVTYRSVAEMQTVIDAIEASIVPVKRRKSSVVLTTFGRGY